VAYLDVVTAFLASWPETLAIDFFRYTVPAGLSFAFLYLWKDNPLLGRKIQPGFVDRAHHRREFGYSLSSILIFSINGTVIYKLVEQGWTQVYFSADGFVGQNWGGLYWVFSVVVITIAHDAYFYWSHRLMHTPILFRAFHYVHHRSHSPSPLASYSFSPVEAVMQAQFLTIFIFVMPLHPSAIFAFVFFMTMRNVLGHSGYEFFPAGTLTHPILRLSTTHTHHDLHHSTVGHRGYNYGLYFSWWDRWQGTEHPDYAASFERVVRRNAAQQLQKKRARRRHATVSR